jgi:hypothetical protein
MLSTVFASAPVRPTCPVVPGVYAFSGYRWVELPLAMTIEVKRRPAFPAHLQVIAVYPGATSMVHLFSDAGVSICGSGIPESTNFALARAKERRKQREVTIGETSLFSSSYRFEIDKTQAVPLEQKTDRNGTYRLRASILSRGQYILFMQQGKPFESVPVAYDFFIESTTPLKP